MAKGKTAKELNYKIIVKIATLSDSGTWKKQLNVVQWGDNDAKYDIRTWSKDNAISGKGVTLTEEELIALKKALNSLDI